MDSNTNQTQRWLIVLIFMVGLVMLLMGWRTISVMNAQSFVGGEVTGGALVGGEEEGATAVSSQAASDEEELILLPTTEVNPLPIPQDGSLAPAANPQTFEGTKPEHTFQTYVVERGDTPNAIAERFGISPETLLGGNPQLSEESSLLQTDVVLIILPIDGVLHDVQPGETLDDLSLRYGIPVEEMIAYAPNNLEFPYRLYADTQILVPGAVRELFVWTPPDLSDIRSTFGGVPLVVGTGVFRFPVNSRNYTQFYWYGHRGIDIALTEGSAVFASDTGTVTYAGWNQWGFGNLIVVNHGNGYETFYAHLSGINVAPGQIVTQGNIIGATGNTGRSSGPHIHFEIRLNANQDDPCWHIGC